MAKKKKSDTSSIGTLDNWSNWVTIVGFFVTLWFSYITYDLAKTANSLASKSLELSQNDTVQAHQLDELKELYKNAQLQLDKINTQNDLLTAHLLTLNKHYHLDARTNKNLQLANFNKVKMSLEAIKSWYGSLKEDGGDVGFMQEIQGTLQQGIENPYITSKPDLLKKWKNMLNRSYDYSNKIDSLDRGYPLKISNSKEDPEKVRTGLLGSYLDDLLKFIKYNRSVL